MMVLLKKSFVLFLFFCCCSQAYSKENSKILSVYYSSLTELAAVEKTCSENRAILPGDIFQHLKITKEEIKNLLAYKYSETFIKCTEVARSSYLSASKVLRSKTDIPLSNEITAASDELITHFNESLDEYRPAYLMLSAELRQDVEKLPELSKTFDMLLSYEAIMTYRNEPF